MKSQFKKADASGARYALIFGADELARGNGGGRSRCATRRRAPQACRARDLARWGAGARRRLELTIPAAPN